MGFPATDSPCDRLRVSGWSITYRLQWPAQNEYDPRPHCQPSRFWDGNAISRLEFMVVPDHEILPIRDAIRVEISAAPGRRGREFMVIPGDEVLTIDRSVEIRVAVEVGIS